MIAPPLKVHLDPVASSLRRYQLWRSMTRCWAVMAAIGLLVLVLQRITNASAPFVLPGLCLVGFAWAFLIFRRHSRPPSYDAVAHEVEGRDPKLNSLLLAAIAQEPSGAHHELRYLQHRVIKAALDHNRRYPWRQKISENLALTHAVHFIALACFVAVLIALPRSASNGAAAPLSSGIEVTPGDTEVERGTPLVVLGRFPGDLPAESFLVVTSVSNVVTRIRMDKSLDDPVFGATIPEVKDQATYHIQYGSRKTRDFKVGVYDFPQLVRADSRLTYPAYTGLEPKSIEDTRRVSAVEGTALEYTFQLNKPVVSARLVSRDAVEVPLEPDPARSNLFRMKMPIETSVRFDLVLKDAEGRTNRIPPQIHIVALPNRRPDLKLTAPRGDQRVSALQEVVFMGEASDDFGLRDYGMGFALAGMDPEFVTLGTGSKPHEKRGLQHMLAGEALKFEPQQLVSYFLWADDVGPDGQVRRSTSDMYLAEVRPFEEIFRERQGGGQEEQQQGEQQGGSESEQLAELQKEVLLATWKLQRQESGKAASEAFAKDVQVVKEGQERALNLLKQAKGRITDEKARGFADAAESAMNQALEHLGTASDKKSVQSLPPAVKAEQSAYASILKLQSREFQVSRGGGGGGGGGGRMQRELDQLELSQSQDRYETQRQAAPRQNPQQREELQVLNRLKELARRQQDMNERMKELQTALQEAQSEQEREEVRRQLKRLQEQQQEIVQDIDELNQRMDRPENQSRMAEARQELDQTRAEARKAGEELSKGEVSSALAAGTRAERDLEQMREDFRRRTSSQFSEAMQEMRQEARDLAREQEEIAKKIEELSQSTKRTLNDSAVREGLAKELAQQQGGFTNLLEDVRRVSEQAEASEPLLSRQLYDTFRATDPAPVQESLEMTGELVERGFLSQAGRYEQVAREKIEDLKRSVERAAESVLGDETEALRLAQREIENLTEQLDREMAQANAAGRQPGSGQQPGRGAQGAQPGERGNANSPGGEQQDSQQAQTPGGAGASRNQDQAQAQAQGQGRGNGQQPGQQPGQQGSQQPGQQPGQQAGRQPGQNGSGGQGGGQGQGQGSGEGLAELQQELQTLREQGGGNSPRADQLREEIARQQNGGGRGGAPAQGRNQEQANNGNTPGQGGREGGGGPGGGGPGGRRFFENGPGGPQDGQEGPLTGADYTAWSDRLRDVEEMVDLPELQSEISRVRERARAMRGEFRRHGEAPQWDLVKTDITTPLRTVRDRIAEELARRNSEKSLVPIDRDAVPTKFSELVRRYYEQLGSAQ